MDTILALETSCDETTAAVIAGGRHILSNVVLTQEVLHRRFGGVVPELAAREHIRGIVPVVEQALRDAEVTWSDLAAVAVANGPGLAPALVVGVNMAKGIALAHGLPLIAVNHLEGHIYANWLVKTRPPGVDMPRPPELPAVCLVVSGGHTELVIMEDHLQYRLLGRTRDDAAGEAFDKVARLLGLGYPGGPLIERAAQSATPEQDQPPLTRPWLRGTYDFSFSGVKTAMLRHVEAAGGHRRANTGDGQRLRRSVPADGRGCPGRQDLSGGGRVSRPVHPPRRRGRRQWCPPRDAGECSGRAGADAHH